MTNKLGKALANFIDARSAPNEKYQYGLLGNASGTIDVSGREGFVYVRLSTGSEILEVLNGGVISNDSAMVDVKVVIYLDSATGIWRISDILRDQSGGTTGRTITTTDVTGASQTISVNSIAPSSPVGQANTLVMLSPTGASITNITNIVYQTTSTTLEANTSIFETRVTLQKNLINTGETVTIVTDYFWIVARDLRNYGTLVNNGDLLLIG